MQEFFYVLNFVYVVSLKFTPRLNILYIKEISRVLYCEEYFNNLIHKNVFYVNGYYLRKALILLREEQDVGRNRDSLKNVKDIRNEIIQFPRGNKSVGRRNLHTFYSFLSESSSHSDKYSQPQFVRNNSENLMKLKVQ